MAARLEKHDRRIFTPTRSPSWKRGYNRRSAMERIYVDNAYRMENHYIRGLQRMRLRLGLVTVMATALGHAERKGGRWSAWSNCATNRPAFSATVTCRPRSGHGPAHPGFTA